VDLIYRGGLTTALSVSEQTAEQGDYPAVKRVVTQQRAGNEENFSLAKIATQLRKAWTTKN